MNSNVTIVMYHYIRDLISHRYPNIKGLNLELFIQQIKYLKKHYNFITMEELINAKENEGKLPEKAILLTFDDGYLDHYINVFPLLNKYEIQGCFYPPAKAILEHKLLDVNKIHLILATQDISTIIKNIKYLLEIYKNEYHLEKFDFYYQNLAKKSEYDNEKIVFVKLLLQKTLDKEIRQIILDELFKLSFNIDEKIIAQETYMSIEQLKHMARNGMHIGSHGFEHLWLGDSSYTEQIEDIKKSVEFLSHINKNEKYKTFCYPYGSFNNDTLNIISNSGFKLGLTDTSVNKNIANIHKDNILALPRLDTNDIPKNSTSNPQQNEWFTLH